MKLLCKTRSSNKNSKVKLLRPKGYKKPKIDLSKVTWDQMQAIPETEDDLFEYAVFINKTGSELVDKLIKRQTDIKSNVLREIYIGDEEQAIQSINAQQR